jgi:hypothetical protein
VFTFFFLLVENILLNRAIIHLYITYAVYLAFQSNITFLTLIFNSTFCSILFLFLYHSIHVQLRAKHCW